MESYLNENFGEVKAKNSLEEALQRWRDLCSVVKNKKRRFRFTNNLEKRFEADAIRKSNQYALAPISNGDENSRCPVAVLDDIAEATRASTSLPNNCCFRIFLTLGKAIKAIQLLSLQVIFGWTFILINLMLESLSAFLDQMSSPERPQFALLAMTVSFVTLLVCILELVYRSRKEKAVWRKFWFYHPSPKNRPLGTFADNLGFICAASQCLFSTIQFVFYSNHKDNPVRLCIFPIILAVYAVYSHSTKKADLSIGN